ncbi:uroporphyrinogen-III synthase [Bacillus sp. FJAT-45350]|uniref:uroporphyrinogen-III synthase n=1 Tax=Bacillus sp. FJAT-45350 TaxID=2011014 RepID=UPI00211D059B|nr:uroporphyrinogen-III synthase [Bacillus sp. FJAT-45350]
MGNKLANMNIAIGGSRKLEEMSNLITKQGGTPLIRSLQGTTFFDEKHVGQDVLNFVQGENDWCIFTTGIGIEALLNIAKEVNVYDEFVSKISNAKVGSRGYKSINALKKLGITPIATDDDGTNQGLIRSLKSHDLEGKHVMVQLHGESAPRLIQFLEDKGAIVTQILPYKHIAPDVATVDKVCKEIINKEIDAVCFTTAIQVYSLFKHAKEKDYVKEISEAFENQTIAVSVGKVTTEALRDEGVQRIIAPDNERMGAMIIELTNYCDKVNR